MISIFVVCMKSKARHMHRLLSTAACLMVAFAGSLALPVLASSPIDPTVSVNVMLAGGSKIAVLDPTTVRNQSVYVQGQIDWTQPNGDSRYAAGADIYFGVILPGGTVLNTWSPNNSGVVTLNMGYSPLVRARPVTTTGTFTTASANSGNLIGYTFSGTEAKGLYLAFIFMVPAGADPTDLLQWSSVTMQPLFVK